MIFVVDIDPDTNMNTTSIKKQCANYNHLKFNKSFTEQKHISFLHYHWKIRQNLKYIG